MNHFRDQSFDVDALPARERNLLRWFEEAYAHFSQEIVALWPRAKINLSVDHKNVSYEEAQRLKREILCTVHSWIDKDIYVDFFHYNNLAATYFALNSITK
jgi:hypothetical protein